MKKGLIIALASTAVLAGGLLIGPSFVDWNKYRPQIVGQVKTVTGLDVAIAGDLDLAILPYPHITIGGLSVVNPQKPDAPLVTLDRAQVSVALAPLLSGKVSVDTVLLIKPDINVSIAADGTPSWMTPAIKAMTEKKQPAAAAGKQAPRTDMAAAVSLNAVKIKDGAFHYADARSGKSYAVDGVGLEVKGDTLTGPFTLSGDLAWNKQPVKIEAKLGRLGNPDEAVPVQATITLPSSSSKIVWSGVVVPGSAPEAQGEAAVETANLQSLLDMAAGKAGAGASPLAKPFSAHAMVTASAQAVSAQELKLSFAGINAKGSASVAHLTTKPAFDVTLAAADPVDLNLFVPQAGASAKKDAAKAGGGKAMVFLPDGLTMPADMEGTIALSAPALKQGDMLLSNPKLSATLKDRKVDGTVATAVAGGGTIDGSFGLAFGSSSKSEKTGAITLSDPVLSYKLDVKAADGARAVLAVLPQEAVAGVLPFLRDGMTLKASGTLKPSVAALDSASLTVRKTDFSLSGSYALRRNDGRDLLTVKASTDAIDLDAWTARLPSAQPDQKTASAAAPKPAAAIKDAVAKFALPFDADVSLSAAKLHLKSADYNTVGLSARMTGKRLELKSLALKDGKGNNIAAAGTAGDITALKDLDISLQGATSDLKALLDGFSVKTAGLPENLKAAEALAEFKGQADNLSFTANLKAAGGTVEASGALTGLLATPEVGSLALRLRHPSYVDLVRVFNPSFASGVAIRKDVDLFASMKRDGKTVSFPDIQATIGPAVIGGAVTIDTSVAKPAITANLQAGDLPLGEMLGQGGRGGTTTVKAGSTKGQPAQPAVRWSRNAINTAWMQQVNMTLDATAKSFSFGPWAMDNVTAAVTLKDGVLSLTKLDGGMYGGTASLTGKASSSGKEREPLTVDGTAALKNVSLESFVGSFSGARLVRAKGTVSLDADIHSTGISPAALVFDLSGKGKANGSNLVFDGFDLARMSRMLVQPPSGGLKGGLASVLDTTLAGGSTSFDTLDSAFTISEGVITVDPLTLTGKDAVVTAPATVNLPLWTLAMDAGIKLAQPADAPALKVSFKGPLDNPAQTFGRGALEGYVGNLIGEKVQNVLMDQLQKKGILPVAPAAPAAAAPPQDQQPAAGEPQSPPPQQQQPLRPEDAFMGILQGVIQGQ